MMGVSDNKIDLYLILGIVLITILMLLPVLDSGFTSDDSINSFTQGTRQYYNATLHQTYLGWIQMHIALGRFIPLIELTPVFWEFINNLIIYKLLVITLIVSNVLIFGYLIYILTGSFSLGAMSMLLAPISFQLRLYHDPILSFNMQLQIVFLLVTISLISLVFYLKNNKNKYLLAGLFLYLLSLLSYEVTYPFFILYAIIIYYFSRTDIYSVLRLSLPFAILAILCALMPVFIRTHLGISLVGGSSAYAINPNVGDYIIAFAKQIFAAMPLSYSITHLQLTSIDFKTLIVAIGYFILCLAISERILNEKRVKFNIKKLLIFGLAMFILPGILVASSPKYQQELVWGIGYIPVYISYFGLIVMAICVIYALYNNQAFFNKNNPLLIIIIFSLIVSVTAALTYNSNVHVVENSNQNWLYPRIVIENGLKDGLFKAVPNGSVLLADNNHPWEQAGFYFMHSGVRLNYVGSVEPYYHVGYKLFPGSDRHNFSELDKVYYLRYVSSHRNKGYAILGNIENLSASNYSLDSVIVRYAYIFLLNENNISIVDQSFKFEEKDIRLVDSEKDWKLFYIAKAFKINNKSDMAS